MKSRTIENKVVIVTGATGSIGRCTCELLASQGAIIVATGRDRAKLSQLEHQTENPIHLCRVCDVQNSASWSDLIHEVSDHFHRIDVLVQCAGTLFPGALEFLTTDQIESTMQT